MSGKGGESPPSLTCKRPDPPEADSGVAGVAAWKAAMRARASSVGSDQAPPGASLDGPKALSFSPEGGEEAQVAEQPLERVTWIRRSGDAFRISARLLERGGTQTALAPASVVVRNVARTCESPLGFYWQSRRAAGVRAEARLVVRCRHCAACDHSRRREWVARALRELASAEAEGRRTWFVTLTLAPAWRHRLTVLAEAGGSPWAKRPDGPEALSRARRAILGEWVALYVKRLRDVSAARFRYLAALESHEDGEWHIHLLVHEVLGQVSERACRNAWKPTGFAQAKLVRATASGFRRAAAYVAKYIGKELGFPRQRASLHYGHGGLPCSRKGHSPASPPAPAGHGAPPPPPAGHGPGEV